MPLSVSVFTVDELQAATDGFATSNFISAGGSGTLGVFRGTLASGEIVAVKRLAVGTDAQHSLNALMNELYTLGRIVHQNLLPVLGFVYQPPELMLVTPYMARGSLYDALHGGNNAAEAAAALAANSLDAAWRLSFLLGLTRGIQALHGANFVHRDIKSANVLIGDDGRAVLADTGIARRMRAGADATSTGRRGTDGYLDPEHVDTRMLTYKSDVFSVGVVILEMLTGRLANDHDQGASPPLLWRRFRSLRADDWDERVGRVVSDRAACWGGGSPTAGAVVALASLALRATAKSSASRPSIDEVLSTIEELQGGGSGGGGSGGDGVRTAPRQCSICWSAVRSVRFDCGHMMTCVACTRTLMAGASPRCPQCRAPASVAARLMADPMDPTYLMAPPATVQPSVVAGGSGSSSMSDEDILQIMRERCPALQELWPAEADASSWAGVTFRNAGGNSARRVVRLDLESKLGDAVEVPAELGSLTALKRLFLSGNQLTSLPSELGVLTALTRLFLNGNQLTSLPVELGALTALTGLGLNGNQLTSLPAELGALTALTWLNLKGNQLTSLPAELGALTALTALGLSGNQLTSLPAEWEAGAALQRSGCQIYR
jgi:serine/threonine protein kinase